MIDYTYFRDRLEIPNITNEMGVRSTLSNRDALDRYITYYQKQFLEYLFGDLYEDYKENPDNYSDVTDLLDDSVNKISPIANYVFFYFYPTIARKNTTMGTVLNNPENGYINTYSRLVEVWNEMIILVKPALEKLVEDYEYDSKEWENFLVTINILDL